jgi:hypothetical protein
VAAVVWARVGVAVANMTVFLSVMGG